MKAYARMLLSAAAAVLVAGPVAAHEVWLERDGAGPARAYLREIVETEVEPDQTHRLATSVVFTANPARPATLAHKDQYFEAAVTGPGDVRLVNDDVFAPWTDAGVRNGQVYHARAGRLETVAKLDFELVPVKSGGTDFTLLFRGKPVAGSVVTVFSPQKAETKQTTDGAGRIAVPAAQRGRYILVATTSENVARRMSGEDVARVHHMTTLSYVN